MKIGLFDSGIGGLNVLKEFINKYPSNEYIFYGDTLNIPYGDKDKDTLLKLASNIIKFFEYQKVNLIIIACGTVSSNCYNELKKITTIPIIDIISPTINYLKTLSLNNIVLFGTNRTVNSHIFKNNIENIKEIATPEFVPMLESGKIDVDVIKKYIENYREVEAIILGCTHYPLLVNYFKKYVSNKTIFIDMGKVLVNNISISNNSNYKLALYFTKIDDNLINNINKIIKTKYEINLIN